MHLCIVPGTVTDIKKIRPGLYPGYHHCRYMAMPILKAKTNVLTFCPHALFPNKPKGK